MFPYVKTGGLADAVGSLVRTLADYGHELSFFVPGYRPVLEHPAATGASRVLQLQIELGDRFVQADIRAFSPHPNLTVFLVCRDELFDRRFPYGTRERDYDDNDERFIFFCKAVVDVLRILEVKADVVHCHDWQTALLPLVLRYEERKHGMTLAMKTVFTIHNIAFQGIFPMSSFGLTNLPDELLGIDGLEYYGQINFMKGGILFADRVTTVSPTYAREVQTPEFGCGLDGVIAARAQDLVGLINGIDAEHWDPASDPHLPAHYSADDLAGKGICRAELLKRAGFDPAFRGPLFGMVCRFTQQKGMELLLDQKAFFAAGHSRLVLLGTGARMYEDALRSWAESMPDRVSLAPRMDEPLSRLIEAGSDFFLMPSTFEPSGLNQMYSQRYGTIPVVSRVGGLVDTVVDLDKNPREGTGITFPPTSAGLIEGLERALVLFKQKDRMSAARARGMKRDFSWRTAARAYEQLYQDSI